MACAAATVAQSVALVTSQSLTPGGSAFEFQAPNLGDYMPPYRSLTGDVAKPLYADLNGAGMTVARHSSLLLSHNDTGVNLTA